MNLASIQPEPLGRSCRAPQNKSVSRDLKTIKFILRMCCQRSNKFTCCCRPCMYEALTNPGGFFLQREVQGVDL